MQCPSSEPALRPPPQPFWTRSRVRGLVIQGIFVGFMGLVVWFLFANTMGNLARQGIATGFDFLQNRAGFDVAVNYIPFDRDSSYERAFWVAVVNTLVLSMLGIVLATFIGFGIGLARVSRNWLIGKLAIIYIETFRNIPLLLQLFFWYFAVLRPLPGPHESLSFADSIFLNNRGLFMPQPQLNDGSGLAMLTLLAGICAAWVMTRRARILRERSGRQVRSRHWWLTGLIIAPGTVFMITDATLTFSMPELGKFNYRGGMAILPEMLAALLGLSIYIAASVAEIVRSGIEGIDRGQTEAAEALGHTRGQLMRFVVIPQAMRIIIPPLTTQYLSLAKNTSLAAVIAFPEIISIVAGTMLTQTGQALETISLAMGFYLCISLTIAVVGNILNYRVTRRAL